jgi:hypothetical protein
MALGSSLVTSPEADGHLINLLIPATDPLTIGKSPIVTQKGGP